MYLKGDLFYFRYLTAEEQLHDVKEYFFRESRNLDNEHMNVLRDMLLSECRERADLINDIARINYAFSIGKEDDILKNGQRSELKSLNSTVLTVPTAKTDVFIFWARSHGYDYRLIAEHNCAANEYLIWKPNNSK